MEMPGKENERGGVWKVKADAEDRNGDKTAPKLMKRGQAKEES